MDPIINKKLGDSFGDIFDGVEKDALQKIKSGERKEEDHITSTWMTLAEERIRKAEIPGFNIETRQFQGRGANSDESITGADGAIVLNARFNDTEVHKFYLFQAKNFSNGNPSFDERAVDQKWRMLAFTADSFFLTYQGTQFDFFS